MEPELTLESTESILTCRAFYLIILSQLKDAQYFLFQKTLNEVLNTDIKSIEMHEYSKWLRELIQLHG